MSGSLSLNGRECRPGSQNPVTLKSPIILDAADEGQIAYRVVTGRHRDRRTVLPTCGPVTALPRRTIFVPAGFAAA